jgi:NAD(P)-dependent dehydrogenase (short-subunit alcohol dehydrogenase family)
MNISVDDWDAVLDTNLKGAFLLTQVLPAECEMAAR